MPLKYYTYDLSGAGRIGKLMKKIFGDIDLPQAESVSLVNNAGILEPVRPLQRCSPEELDGNIRINLTAPMVITSLFIRMTKDMTVPKRVLNITSGAGRNPYHGWSAYCASKAGINMLTQCAALEQSREKYPVRVIAFSPGPVDTKMQGIIRSSDADDFPERGKFIDYQEAGGLLSADRAAEALLKVLGDEKFANGSIISIRDIE